MSRLSECLPNLKVMAFQQKGSEERMTRNRTGICRLVTSGPVSGRGQTLEKLDEDIDPCLQCPQPGPRFKFPNFKAVDTERQLALKRVHVIGFIVSICCLMIAWAPYIRPLRPVRVVMSHRPISNLKSLCGPRQAKHRTLEVFERAPPGGSAEAGAGAR